VNQWGGMTAEKLAVEATQNPNSTKVVLGKFNEGGISYTKVATNMDATYFELAASLFQEIKQGSPVGRAALQDKGVRTVFYQGPRI
jgi:hypothetical protein